MSLFLPEGSKTPSLQSPGVAEPTNPEVTDADLKLMQRIFSAASQYPNMIPDSFMGYLLDYIQTGGLIIPIGQVFGFSQFTAQQATVNAGESTPSTTAYGDLTTVGPQLTGLSDGSYVFFFGALNNQAAGALALMGLDTGGGADDAQAIEWITNGNFIPGARAVTATLAGGGSNTVTAKYRTSVAATPATFANRWLVGIKYANH